MQPTLNPAEEGPRDRVVVDKFSLTVGRTPKRGDVFLVRSPHDPDGWLVKRMVRSGLHCCLPSVLYFVLLTDRCISWQIAIEGDTVRTRSDEMVHVPQVRPEARQTWRPPGASPPGLTFYVGIGPLLDRGGQRGLQL